MEPNVNQSHLSLLVWPKGSDADSKLVILVLHSSALEGGLLVGETG